MTLVMVKVQTNKDIIVGKRVRVQKLGMLPPTNDQLKDSQ